MPRSARTVVSILLLAMLLIPQVALASPLTPKGTMPVGIDPFNGHEILGETQVEYPMHIQSGSSDPTRIVSIAHTPTRSGNYVYPNVEVWTVGQANVVCYVTLYKQVNGQWEEVTTIVDGNTSKQVYRFSPGTFVQTGCTYKYSIYVDTSGIGWDRGSLHGNPFYLN